MAKKSMIQKWMREPKYPGRKYNRCHRCGRPRAYIRYFGICRSLFPPVGPDRRLAGNPQGQLVSDSLRPLALIAIG